VLGYQRVQLGEKYSPSTAPRLKIFQVESVENLSQGQLVTWLTTSNHRFFLVKIQTAECTRIVETTYRVAGVVLTSAAKEPYFRKDFEFIFIQKCLKNHIEVVTHLYYPLLIKS